MDAQVEALEARLRSFLGHFKSEFGVLERIVHKNRNQHRRSSYFQYLLYVRRDCKFLELANLEELVNSCFLVINGNRPKQKIQLLESLKRRKCDGDQFNYLVRLQGAARLLSQMPEPIFKAAIEISTLLARSFFMGFSMTVLALLARLRVLTQQILLDVVSVFNMVSSLSQKQQSVKLNHDGIEVFREYYPAKEQQSVFLECVWKTDKFVLLERKTEPENKHPETIVDEIMSGGLSSIEYQSIETLLGGNEPMEVLGDKISEEGPANTRTEMEGLVEGENDVKDQSGVSDASIKNIVTSSSADLNGVKAKPELKKKVAFISVKRPEEPSKANETGLQMKSIEDKEDPFFSLLTGGTL